MRFLPLGLMSCGLLATTASAFVQLSRPEVSSLSARSNVGEFRAETVGSDCECASPQDEVSVPSLVNTKGSAQAFRSAILTDANGNTIRLGDKMGPNKSVVIFLRHLGCPYCWSYAREWCKVQRKIEASGAVGPLFVSIGDDKKLQRFLELNAYVPKDQAFVDDYNMEAYESAGLGNMELGQQMPEDLKMRAPDIGGLRAWWKYMTNVMDLSPVPEGSKEFPEGVKRLGGTFVIDGDDVIYQWNDRVPGDTPELEDVLKLLADDE